MQPDKKSNNSEFIFEKATEEQINNFRLDYQLINFMIKNHSLTLGKKY